MRFLQIPRNTILKRFLAGAAGALCCTFLWEDIIEWVDNCRWKEPSCCSYLWDNQAIWNQNCPVRADQDCCSSNEWNNLKSWGDDCDWIDGYTPPQ